MAAELVRGYAAIDELLQEQYSHEGWATPDVVAERLEATRRPLLTRDPRRIARHLPGAEPIAPTTQ